MPRKKKTGKGEGRSRSSSAGKGEAKAPPVEASQAGAGQGMRETKASEQGDTTSASKRARGASAEKPRPKRNVAAKASTRGPRRKADPLQAVLADAPPTREQIAVRAYELFVKGGYQHGHSEQHWLQAERELKREYAAKKRGPGEPRPTFSSV
jgi:hypothetical protein